MIYSKLLLGECKRIGLIYNRTYRKCGEKGVFINIKIRPKEINKIEIRLPFIETVI